MKIHYKESIAGEKKEAEEQINDLEDRLVGITAVKQNKEIMKR